MALGTVLARVRPSSTQLSVLRVRKRGCSVVLGVWKRCSEETCAQENLGNMPLALKSVSGQCCKCAFYGDNLFSCAMNGTQD